MNISYDIFDLSDFPIVVTDESFIITYKNRLAAKFFGLMRKRSKITRYFRNFKNDIDFSIINELDIETGTHFMRALVLPLKNGAFAFLFFTIYSFTDTKNLVEYVREKYAGDFIDFYCSAYKNHLALEKSSFSARADSGERVFSELSLLLSSFAEKPEFLKSEICNISEILELTAKQINKKLSALGAKSASAQISLGAKSAAFAKINLRFFTFILFRMISAAIKFSDSRELAISLESPAPYVSDVCVCTKCTLPNGTAETGDFYALLHLLPEFSFEFEILKSIGFFEDTLYFTYTNSTLKLHFKLKCDASAGFVLRSEPEEIRKRRIEKAIADAIRAAKALISKK